MKFLIRILLFLTLPHLAVAEVHIAFIELLGPQGRVIQLTPGGRFGHSAISYQGGWLHAYPRRGVEVTSLEDLESIGRVVEIVTLVGRAEPSPQEVDQYLGRAFDYDYSWTDEKIYCAELLAKLLGLEPEPMIFDEKLWPGDKYQKLNGQPGLSPDAIYERFR